MLNVHRMSIVEDKLHFWFPHNYVCMVSDCYGPLHFSTMKSQRTTLFSYNIKCSKWRYTSWSVSFKGIICYDNAAPVNCKSVRTIWCSDRIFSARHLDCHEAVAEYIVYHKQINAVFRGFYSIIRSSKSFIVFVFVLFPYQQIKVFKWFCLHSNHLLANEFPTGKETDRNEEI